MATKKFAELQKFSEEELKTELKESLNEYSKLKFDHKITGLENPLSIRNLRRDIARLNTEMRKRQMSGMSEEAIGKRSKIRLRRKLNK